MKASELISILEEAIEQNEDAEVKIAEQPSWPFEYEINGAEIIEQDGKMVVYIVEGNQLKYLPEKVAVGIGWQEQETFDEEEIDIEEMLNEYNIDYASLSPDEKGFLPLAREVAQIVSKLDKSAVVDLADIFFWMRTEDNPEAIMKSQANDLANQYLFL